MAIAAGDSAPESAPAAETPADSADAKRVLTPEELAEKDARKACKAKICDIIASRDPLGEDVSCDIVKTWREEDIVKMPAARSAGHRARRFASRGSRSSARTWHWR